MRFRAARLPAAVLAALCLAHALVSVAAVAQAHEQRYIVVFKEGGAPLPGASAFARAEHQKRSMDAFRGLAVAAGLEKSVQVDYEYGNAVYGLAARYADVSHTADPAI
eukprot:tig00021348_g20504.t1